MKKDYVDEAIDAIMRMVDYDRADRFDVREVIEQVVKDTLRTLGCERGYTNYDCEEVLRHPEEWPYADKQRCRTCTAKL